MTDTKSRQHTVKVILIYLLLVVVLVAILDALVPKLGGPHSEYGKDHVVGSLLFVLIGVPIVLVQLLRIQQPNKKLHKVVLILGCLAATVGVFGFIESLKYIEQTITFTVLKQVQIYEGGNNSRYDIPYQNGQPYFPVEAKYLIDPDGEYPKLVVTDTENGASNFLQPGQRWRCTLVMKSNDIFNDNNNEISDCSLIHPN